MTAPSRVVSTALTHPGAVRPNNEDSHLLRDAAGIWAVADGMGGHDAGDLASRMLIDGLRGVAEPTSAAELLAACEACVADVNAQIYELATGRGTVIGTTLALLLGYDVHYACVWSGDSRVYLVRGGRIAMLSHDHTEVQELVDRGILTMEESRLSARRNVITRAIGVASDAELESVQGTFEPDDVFVLCSDGLTGYVTDDELRHRAATLPGPEACRQLLGLALERGGADNITVAVVRFLGGEGQAGRIETAGDTVVDLPFEAVADPRLIRDRT